MTKHFELYSGSGKPLAERSLELPESAHESSTSDPSKYVASPELRDAVNVAIALGQPLLLTGEPGTGKSELAKSIAHELGLDKPLVSHVKTSSTARDLFYRYDALRHFHDSNVRSQASGSATTVSIADYIEYEALGLAILLSMEGDEVTALLPGELRGLERPRRSVVLLDEIDKAPRDLPNDILNEIENMEFTIKETGRTLRAKPGKHPIVILTSNSERNLPDAFLRRCVFFHLTFPEGDALARIIDARVGASWSLGDGALKNAVGLFEEIRSLGALKKKPATAELLGWLRLLNQLQIDPGNVPSGERGQLTLSYSLLAKTKEDLHLLHERFGS